MPESGSQIAQQELTRLHQYRAQPAQWMVDFLGFGPETLWWDQNEGYEDHQWDSTIQFPHEDDARPCPNPLVAMLRAWAAGYQRIALQSAAGVGKTFLMAAGVLHYLDTHRPSLVKCFAPTEDTLEDQLFGYIGQLMSGLGQAGGFSDLHPQAKKHNDLNLYMQPEADDRDRWKASGDPVEAYSGEQADYEAQSAAGAQGSHAEWQTLIIEEAPGVHSSIWNALDITLSKKNQLIAYGNPDSESDPLNKFASRPSTLRIRLSGFDHPNHVTGEEVIPGAIAPTQPAKMEEKFGSRDHPMWKSRVRGICPKSSGACLFKEKAIEAVERHFRASPPEGGRLQDQPWADPMFELPHDPARWRQALLRLAQSGSGEDEELSDAEEEALGIYDIEGHTRIYEPPRFDKVGRYMLGLDVAGDYAQGDYHAGFVFDRIERHVVAELHLEGPREAYALAALALAKTFRVPYVRNQSLEEGRDEQPQAWLAERYIDLEREVRKTPTEVTYEGRKKSYPCIAWETNGVGALHKIGPFKAYPHLYRDKSPDVAGGKRSRRMGWQTTKGDTGTRTEIIENLRTWQHRLSWEPDACPSEGLLSEMKSFKKDKDKGRYEAEAGEHDDRVMALGICLTAGDRIPEPVDAKTPDRDPQKTSRSAAPDVPSSKDGDLWRTGHKSGTWGLPND